MDVYRFYVKYFLKKSVSTKCRQSIMVPLIRPKLAKMLVFGTFSQNAEVEVSDRAILDILSCWSSKSKSSPSLKGEWASGTIEHCQSLYCLSDARNEASCRRKYLALWGSAKISGAMQKDFLKYFLGVFQALKHSTCLMKSLCVVSTFVLEYFAKILVMTYLRPNIPPDGPKYLNNKRAFSRLCIFAMFSFSSSSPSCPAPSRVKIGRM